MAIGATEIVTGFDVNDDESAYGPKIGKAASVCGACGSLVFAGMEAAHNSNQHAGALTVRAARSPWSKDAGGVPNSP
jgi:hypothetical protein